VAHPSDGRRFRSAVGKFDVLVRSIWSRWLLRRCDRLGRWSRATTGAPLIHNDGTITLGSRVRLTCSYAPVELRADDGGVIELGDRVAINFGTSLVARSSISIGSNVSIAPFCVIDDSSPDGVIEPITIGDGCWLASRVVVLPGSHLGAGSVVTAGSVVSGHIPPGVVVGGAPLRTLRHLDGSPSAPLDDGRPLPIKDASRVRQQPSTDRTPIRRYDGILISDFTIDPLAIMLARRQSSIELRAEVAPFDQVVPTLLDPPQAGRDFAVVWTQPSSVVPAMGRLAAGDTVTEGDLHEDVDSFASLIGQGLGEFTAVIVPTWTQPVWKRGRGVADLRPGGAAWALAIVNMRLVSALSSYTNVFVVDAARWTGAAGTRAYNERAWYAGKVPFGNAVFESAADDIVAAIESLGTAPRKLLVLDLDNTLWGGVVGDVGVDNLVLGGHDADGEAFVDFQASIAALRRQGVLLAIASKNEEATGLAAIDTHEAMRLRREDFVAWRINWNDKADNIAQIAAELNLGLQSVVFIDDNPHERERVRDALPEVLVPEWPPEPTDYVRALESLSCFDHVSTTAEDLARTELYQAERVRTEMKKSVSSVQQWIEELAIVVTVMPLSPANIVRATQLLNKTNQMNLTTRRLNEDEFLGWSNDEHRHVVTISIADRLGDAGLTGIVSVEAADGTAHIVDFVLSCRVMGRSIEDAMLSVAAELAAELGCTAVAAEVRPTDKNAPCQAFFARSGWTDDGGHRFSSDVSDIASFPTIFGREGSTTTVAGQ
jgi:FkbH-like protein